MMEDLVVIGLQELKTLFRTYEYFLGHLCNLFFRSLMFVDLYAKATRIGLLDYCDQL